MEAAVQQPANWRHEFSRLLRLALPIIGAQLAQVGMGVVDTVMAGHLSAVDLAGVALGGSVMWPVTLLCMGFLQAVTPSVAQLNGAGRQEMIGEVIRQGLWVALVCAALGGVVLYHAGAYYRIMDVDPSAVAVSLPYLKACAFGLPAVLAYFVLRFLAEGLGRTRPAMLIATSALVIKIPLNYCFIYGIGGMEGMGGVGCGVSTAIVMWFECMAMLYVVTRSRYDFTGWVSGFSWPRADIIGELMRVGFPIGITLFFEVGFFTFVTVLIGRFGADVVASHSIAMNTGGIAFMFPMALGMAATIRVGFNIGAGQPVVARQAAVIALAGTVCFAIVSASFIVTFRHFIAGLFTSDPGVIDLAAQLMLFVSVYQLFDNCQATAIGALRGYKDTRTAMLITLVGYWFVGLPVASGLGFGWIGRPLHIYGFWIGVTVALAFVAILVSLRLWRVSARSLQTA